MPIQTLKEFQRSFPILLSIVSLIGKKGAKNEENRISSYFKGIYGRSLIFSLHKLEANLITVTNFLFKFKNQHSARKPRVLFVGSNQFLKYLERPILNPEIKELRQKFDWALASNLTPGCLSDWNKKILQPTINFITLPEFTQGDFKKNRYASFLKFLAPLKNKPDLIIFLSADLSYNTLKECKILNIPTIAVVNSNADPAAVDYIIPASDNIISQFIIFKILYQTLKFSS